MAATAIPIRMDFDWTKKIPALVTGMMVAKIVSLSWAETSVCCTILTVPFSKPGMLGEIARVPNKNGGPQARLKHLLLLHQMSLLSPVSRLAVMNIHVTRFYLDLYYSNIKIPVLLDGLAAFFDICDPSNDLSGPLQCFADRFRATKLECYFSVKSYQPRRNSRTPGGVWPYWLHCSLILRQKAEQRSTCHRAAS